MGAAHRVPRRHRPHDRLLPDPPRVVPVTTEPARRSGTEPAREAGTVPAGRSGTVPAGRSGTVPVVDLARRAERLGPALDAAVARVLASGTYLLGPELDAFEAELAAYAGVRHAVGVASGTDALRLGLVAMGIGAGDEVMVPAFTAVPTAAAVCATGATPVFVDVDPATAAI